MPLTLLQSGIAEALDQRKHTVGIFIALAKAFDTVNHYILLIKSGFAMVSGLSLG